MKDEELKALVQKSRDIQVGDMVRIKRRIDCTDVDEYPNYTSHMVRQEGKTLKITSSDMGMHGVESYRVGDYYYRADWLELV